MKILYIHQYFKTPEEGGAIRSYYLAKGLVDHGYEVEMITAHNANTYVKRKIDGIDIHYLPVRYDNVFGFVKRVYSFLKFFLLAFKLAKKIKKVDFVYATSTPLTVGLIALKIKHKLKIPYFFEVRDLWPDAPIQMKAIKSNLLKQYLFKLERKIYKHADKIIALSPGIRNHIEKIVPKKPIYIIPNMSDCDFFNISLKNKAIEKKYDCEDKFVICYFGAVGKVNHLEHFLKFIESANRREKLKLSFLIVGKGASLKVIKKIAAEKKLKNLTFVDFQDKSGLRDVLSISDAAYISFASKPVLETNSPNKYFDALAAGKLIITNTDGWIREVTEIHKCGFYANPDQADDAIMKLKPFILDKNLLLNYQKNARSLAELYYSRELQIQKLIKVINNEHHLRVNDSSVYILTA